MKAHRSEQGQVLVLIVLAIVGLLGFAALAVDGGMLYSERRRAQNAVDAAALASASAIVHSTGDPFVAAMGMLQKNGYNQDLDPNLNADKPQDVQVFHPPVTGPYTGNNEYYQVKIRQRVEQFFSQLVYAGKMEITVEAIAHARGSDSDSPGNAMHALSENTCPGIVFNGGTNITIAGGNIYSNTADNTSGGCTSAVMSGSSGNVQVTSGQIETHGTFSYNPGVTISPLPIATGVPVITVPIITPPDCSGLPTYTFDPSVTTLQPGTYGSISIPNGSYTMQPGLYCINGSFTVNGGNLYGANIEIYMMGTGGDLSFGGNGVIQLYKGANGVLIYMDQANHNGVDISGNSGSTYQGTIYAPSYRDPSSKEKCNIGGNGTTAGNSLTLRSNLICYTIGVSGSSNVSLTYRPEENHRAAAIIELTQ